MNQFIKLYAIFTSIYHVHLLHENKQGEGQGAVPASSFFSICVLSLHRSPSVSFKVQLDRPCVWLLLLK